MSNQRARSMDGPCKPPPVGSGRPRLRTGVALASLAMGSAACAVAAPRPRATIAVKESPGSDRKRTPFVSPPRLFVLPERSDTSYATTTPDGNRRLIALGLRMVDQADGTLERADELLPTANPAQAITLPDRLGGGYLFYVAGPSGTSIWRAQEWTGKLAPLARLDLRATRVEAGFDRLYVGLEESGETIALDAETGRGVDLGPLPPSPAYRAMSYADAWFGAVDVPVRGLLVSFDAGGSWRPVGLGPVSGLTNAGGRLVIGSSGVAYSLDAAGQLREAGADSSTDPLFDAALAKLSSLDPGGSSLAPLRDTKLPPGKLGRRPLREAVLHGWPDTSRSAVVIAQGALGRVRLDDGKPLAVRPAVVPPGEACHAVKLGQSFGFVCGREGGGTTIHAFEPPLGLRPVAFFAEPRFVSSSGNGALVVRGGCRPKDARPAQGLPYCLRSPTGDMHEILVRGDVGVERVAALANGQAVVLVPPRFESAGLLTLLGGTNESKTARLRFVRSDSPTRRLLGRGLWLDGLQQTGPDELAGWVVGAETLVGVRVSLDGRVKPGPVTEEPERALLSGLYGLVLPKSGVPQQTIDGGQTWRSVELPWQLDDAKSGIGHDERGCGPVGCAVGPWVRVGWQDGPAKAESLRMVETPPETTVPTSSGGRWRLNCVPTGEATARSPAPARPEAPLESPRRISSEPVTSTSWLPFHGVMPPTRTANELGLDRGLEGVDRLLHAYLWGVRGADWRQSGQWLVRAADRFALRDSVWSTRVSRSYWPDALTAANAFGRSAYGSISSSWRAAFEPGGRAAALLIGNDLFLIEAGRTVARVKDPAAYGLTEPAGAVKLGDQWYLGADGSSFSVLRVDGDRLSVLGKYPVYAERQQRRTGLNATLVRTEAADGLAIWVRSDRTRGSQSRWFLYPLDPVSGAARDPVEVGPAELGVLPPPCGEGDQGWLLDGSPPVAPYVDLDGSGVGVWRLEARLLVSPIGLCLEALAADAQAELPSKLGLSRPVAAGTGWVPLALAARSDPTFRRGFRCTR